MFSYNPLFKTLIDKEIPKARFNKEVKLSQTTARKLLRNEPVNMEILDRICTYLNCPIEAVMEHRPDEQKKIN